MGLLQNVILIFTIGLLQVVFCNVEDGPIYQTNLGKVQGLAMTSDGGHNFFAFRGIPFAQPPVKELRFKDPKALVGKWDGIFDATEDGATCIQHDIITKEMTGDEDCLYLNVYTPKYETQVFDNLLPVMVFIHGGGFFSGTGALSLYGPQRMMDKTGIILVTINYRLGPFGFLTTMNESSPGNYGMLDQVLALKWVRNNIGAFGGDSNQVTIFGESVGSVSVGLHMISPLSKGLFHAAIAQSGSAFSGWLTPLDHNTAYNYAKDLAEKLRCPIHCHKAMIKCLTKLPALDIIVATAHLSDQYLKDDCSLIVFKPVVDGTLRGENAFLPDSPETLVAEKRFNPVPLVSGVVKDEGFFFIDMCAKGSGGIASFDKGRLATVFKAFMPSLFKNEELGKKISEDIISSYFDNVDANDSMQKMTALSAVYGDSFMNYKVDVFNEFFAKHGVPTYVYKFVHKGEHTIGENIPNEMVVHGDDLQFLFRCAYFNSTTLSDEDKQMADVMLTLWTNFAKTKTPTLEDSAAEHTPLKWEPITSSNYKYLLLNLAPQMVNDHLSVKYKLWSRALSYFPKDEL